MSRPQLPDGLEHVRITDIFDNTTVLGGRCAPTESVHAPPTDASGPPHSIIGWTDVSTTADTADGVS